MKKNFPLVKNSGKILQKVKIFHKVNPNKKLKLLKQQFLRKPIGGSTHMQNFRPQKFLCL